MCGRYDISLEVTSEIERLIGQEKGKLLAWQKGEVHPAGIAPAIVGKNGGLFIEKYRWGFPHFDPKHQGVIYNARSETALEKKMFKESVLHRRCVIPAAGFYEWSKRKDKYFFHFEDGKALLFAGFYNQYAGENRFVILTTQANESVVKIHDRMPLILEPEEVSRWILEDEATEFILSKKPKELKIETKGQMSFFD